MRKRYALVGLLPFGILAACEGEQTGASIGPVLDGGGVTLDRSAPPDDVFVPTDAAVEAQAVTVSVTRRGAPAPGIVVVYQDANGVVLGPETTNASGIAARIVPAGSQVTVLFGTSSEPNVLTITDVEPGDILATIDPSVVGELPSPTITSLPGKTPGSSFLAYAGNCSGSFFEGPPGSIDLHHDCHQYGAFPVIVFGYSDGQNVGYTFKKGNTLVSADGGVVTPEIALERTWSNAYSAHTIRVENGVHQSRIRTSFAQVADGVPMNTDDERTIEEPNAPPFEHQHQWMPGYPDFVQSEAATIEQVVVGNDAFLRVSGSATREAVPSGDATTTINAATFLPSILTATIDETTVSRPLVAWTTANAAPLATVDGALIHFTWQSEVETHGTVRGTWTFVTPPTRTSVKAPALPESHAGYAPSGTEIAIRKPPIVSIVDASFLQGYRDARKVTAALSARQSLLWNDRTRGLFIPPLPSAGTVRATIFMRNLD